MIYVKGLNIKKLQEMLLTKTVRFKSDCVFFPNFDVTGKVIRITYSNMEIIIEILTKNRKQLKIGSNMKNLRFEIL